MELFRREINICACQTLEKKVGKKGRANRLGIKRLKREILEPDGFILNYVRIKFHKTLEPNEVLYYFGDTFQDDV